MFNKKYIKFIAVAAGIVILTAYYQISNFANNITNQFNEVKTSNVEKVHYDNMIYFSQNSKLPLPFRNREVIITSLVNLNRIHPVLHIRRPHNGTDIVGKGKGCEILAIANGKIKAKAYQQGGAGNYIIIDHGDLFHTGQNITTSYFHMKDPSPFNVGDNVKAGDVIGNQGNTGIGTGEHLHLELRFNGAVRDIRPYLFGEELGIGYHR